MTLYRLSSLGIEQFKIRILPISSFITTIPIATLPAAFITAQYSDAIKRLSVVIILPILMLASAARSPFT